MCKKYVHIHKQQQSTKLKNRTNICEKLQLETTKTANRPDLIGLLISPANQVDNMQI